MKTEVNTTIQKDEGKIIITTVVIEEGMETDRVIIEHSDQGSFTVHAGNGKYKQLFNHNYFNQ